MTLLTRRRALLGAAALPLWATARSATAQSQGPYTLPPLPYAPDANEPHIDARTMTLHHDRHHASYVSNLNAAVKDHSQAAKLPVRDLLRRIGEMPESIRTTLRNNGGGHANHAMFWPIMGGKGGSPSGDLAQAIDRDLGGLDKLKSDFNAAGGRVFGSGWVFVTVSREGRLALATRPNQDTPLMDGEMVLMGNDVWEHAYYLKYQNRRADYLAAWWNTLNWQEIARRHEAARAGTLEL
jgi:Fe-Mn family superoxide dismutase